MNIDYDLYKIFLSVAKHQSFTKAADELFLTQPTVSVGISKLEGLLEKSLFNRAGKRITLSMHGSHLQTYLLQGNRFFDTAYDFMKKVEFPQTKIKFACPASLTSYFLNPVLKKNIERNPEFNFSVISVSGAENRIKYLQNNIVDFAIAEQSDTYTDDTIEVKKFAKVTYKLIYNPEFYHFDESTTLQQVFQNKILLQSMGTRARSYFDSLIGECFPQNFSDYTYSECIIYGVAMGLGVGFVPVEYVHDDKIKTLDLISKEINVNVLYKKHNADMAKQIFFL